MNAWLTDWLTDNVIKQTDPFIWLWNELRARREEKLEFIKRHDWWKTEHSNATQYSHRNRALEANEMARNHKPLLISRIWTLNSTSYTTEYVCVSFIPFSHSFSLNAKLKVAKITRIRTKRYIKAINFHQFFSGIKFNWSK